MISNHFLQVYRPPDLTISSVIIFHAHMLFKVQNVLNSGIFRQVKYAVERFKIEP